MVASVRGLTVGDGGGMTVVRRGSMTSVALLGSSGSHGGAAETAGAWHRMPGEQRRNTGGQRRRRRKEEESEAVHGDEYGSA